MNRPAPADPLTHGTLLRPSPLLQNSTPAGGPDAPDVTESVQNLAINVTALTALLFFLKRDLDNKEKDLKRADREEALSRLQVSYSCGAGQRLSNEIFQLLQELLMQATCTLCRWAGSTRVQPTPTRAAPAPRCHQPRVVRWPGDRAA